MAETHVAAPLPDFVRLVGDEDAGVTLECSHSTHSGGSPTPIIYLGLSAPSGLAVAEDLNDLIRCIYVHVASHGE